MGETSLKKRKLIEGEKNQNWASAKRKEEGIKRIGRRKNENTRKEKIKKLLTKDWNRTWKFRKNKESKEMKNENKVKIKERRK